MNCNFNFGRKIALLILGGLLCLLGASADAQTSSGQLTITMNVQSSITLVFQDNPAVGTTDVCVRELHALDGGGLSGEQRV